MHKSTSCTSAFITSSGKSWVLDSGASTHITGGKEKLHSLSFLDNISPLNVVDDTFSTVREK